ncbi:MAG: hypothetical protein U1F67_09185 [Rubrivivax sp.]
MLDVYETQRTALPRSCAALAARAFALYRSRGGAEVASVARLLYRRPRRGVEPALLTRDRGNYKTAACPPLKILAP